MLARGAEALGIDWTPTPLATVSAPRGRSPPCVYRGFCVIGCSTNAKQSALVTWIPRALAAGAEIRDLAMVGRIETDDDRAASPACIIIREGRWRFQRARNVVVAGYAIETPRLLLNSATRALSRTGSPTARASSASNLMAQSNQAVWGMMDEEVRWYKGPPSLAHHRALELRGRGKDFFGGYCYMSQGPLPVAWAGTMVERARPLGRGAAATRWRNTTIRSGSRSSARCCREERNRVTLADEKDQYGLPIARVTFSCGDNDRG